LRRFLNGAGLLLLLPLLAQTSDINQVMNSIMMVVVSVIPVLVLVLVLRLLFNSFNDISRVEAVKIRLTRLFKPALLITLVGQTSSNWPYWNTNIDLWGTIVTIVMTVVPFLVLIIVLRSIFHYFSKEW